MVLGSQRLGDEPRLYAINKREPPHIQLAQTVAIDWEDIAAVTIAEQRYLVVGTSVIIMSRPVPCIVEPVLNAKQNSNEVVLIQRPLTQRYIYLSVSLLMAQFAEHGMQSALPSIRKHEKSSLSANARLGGSLSRCDAQLRSPQNQWNSNNCGPLRNQVQKSFKGIAIPHMPTAMDIHPSGDLLVIGNYVDLWLYRKQADQNWAEVLTKQQPTALAAPVLQQMEALCLSKAGDHLMMTSEQVPAPFIRLPIPAADH